MQTRALVVLMRLMNEGMSFDEAMKTIEPDLQKADIIHNEALGLAGGKER